jgi:predicted Fe-Mo cluster-binding NifX family protein
LRRHGARVSLHGTQIAPPFGMNVAIPVWSERVSPVFDVAQRLLVVGVEEGREIARREHGISVAMPGQRARQVAELGVNVLICGAISRPLEAMLYAAGVRVVPQICGSCEEVLQAWLAGALDRPCFLMPGCRGGGWRRQGRCRRGQSFGRQGGNR